MLKRLLVAILNPLLKQFWFAALLLNGGMLTFSAAQAEEYLAPEAAFIFSARMLDASRLEINYLIADGHYLYRDRFYFKADGAMLGQPDFPHGKQKYDENLQKEVETYRGSVSIRIPVVAGGKFKLMSTAQGCADKGLCYPPMESVTDILHDAAGDMVGASPVETTPVGKLAATLDSGRFLTIIAVLFVFGVGLSLLPCTWPMLPILSSIIIGDCVRQSRGRGLLLSIIYALGMALIYSGFGVAAALAGEGLSAWLQNPWILSMFALLLLALALSMFDVYQLQVPASLQSALSVISGKQRRGKLLGVFFMGALSALIVGPCVTPPLAVVLLYISQTRDVVLGAVALFSLAMGMSVPLLLIGMSAGALLPRAGRWMDEVKRFFGVVMLATAWWMLASVLPAWLLVLGWGVLSSAYGVYLLGRKTVPWMARVGGLVFLALGLLQLLNVASGGRDPLSPLSHLGGRGNAFHAPAFERVRSVAELEAALRQASGKPVMLDFYADWCVSCKEMERFTFSDARVREKLAQMALLQIDVSANNNDDKIMLKHFELFGPPGIILFDREGRELTHQRVIGYQNAEQFLQSLQAVIR